jgi:hypothetical protein
MCYLILTNSKVCFQNIFELQKANKPKQKMEKEFRTKKNMQHSIWAMPGAQQSKLAQEPHSGTLSLSFFPSDNRDPPVRFISPKLSLPHWNRPAPRNRPLHSLLFPRPLDAPIFFPCFSYPIFPFSPLDFAPRLSKSTVGARRFRRSSSPNSGTVEHSVFPLLSHSLSLPLKHPLTPSAGISSQQIDARNRNRSA